MNELLKLLPGRAFSLLLGFAVMTYVAPATKGGAILLMIVAVVVVEVILQAFRLVTKVAKREPIVLESAEKDATGNHGSSD